MAGTLGTISGQVRLDIRQAVGAYAAVRAQNARTVYALRGTGDSFVAAGKTMAVAGGAMVYGFAKVVQSAAEFERKMDFASAVSGTTGKKLQELSDYALTLGKDTIFSAGEIADGFIELAKSGVRAEDIIKGVGEAMTNLGAAGDIPLAQSGQIIVSTLSQFQLGAQDAVRVSDLLAGAANASIADISDLGVSLKYVGGIAHTAGLDFEDVTTALSILANAGIRGSTAGTTLRQMIVSLPGNTEAARTALADLGIITEDGTNRFFDQTGALKPLAEVYEILGNAMKDLTPEQKLSTLRTIFQTRALSAASNLVKAGAEGFKDMNDEMKKTTAADVASARLDNLSGDLEILKGNLETLMIEAGSPFQETLRGWVQAITKLVQAFGKLDPETQKAIVQTVAVTGVALLAMGAFNIVVGTIFKFIASLLKMGAGLKFTGKLLLGFGRFLKGLDFVGLVKNMGPFLRNLPKMARGMRIVQGAMSAVRLLINPITLGILAVASVVAANAAAWVFLYKKVEPVRRILNRLRDIIVTMYDGFKDFFSLLTKDPKKAFGALAGHAIEAIEDIKKLPGDLGHVFDSGKDKVEELAHTTAVKSVEIRDETQSKLGELRDNAKVIFDSMVASARTRFEQLRTTMATKAAQAANSVKFAFQNLPAAMEAAGRQTGFAIGLGLRIMILKGQQMVTQASLIALGIINWFRQLPGRIAAFMTQLILTSLARMRLLAQELPAAAGRAVDGIVNFFRTLPAKIAGFMIRMGTQAYQYMVGLAGRMIGASFRVTYAIMSGIRALPGLVGGVLQNVIDAFLDVINKGYESAKSFASGLWEGFKDGLGINSPSYIEKKMWEITDVTIAEGKKIARETRNIQTTAKKLASTELKTGDWQIGSAPAGYARLASIKASNTRASRTLAEGAGNRSAMRSRRDTRGGSPRNQGKMEMEITNWSTGQGHFRQLAQDTIDDDRDYFDDLDRMG